MGKIQPISLEKDVGQLFDFKTFAIVIGLILIGLLSLYSALNETNIAAFYRQMISAGIGFVAMMVIAFLPKDIIKNSAIFVYGASILLLISVFIFGTAVYGTMGWIRIGGLSFQPAEFAKLGVIMILAFQLSTKGVDIRTVRDFFQTGLYVAIPAGLIFLQPDHGTSSVFIILFMGVLFWSGFSSFILFQLVSIPFMIILGLKGLWYYVGGMIAFGGTTLFFRNGIFWKVGAIAILATIGYLSPVIYNNLMDHQKARIETFLNPEMDPRGSGYNVIQSIYAVGSGGLTGKGYLQGTQTQLRYVPMQWTDFIFSVPTEEFGFFGGLAVVLLFAGLIYRTITIASEAEDKFFSVTSIGAGIIFLYHVLINVGMVIGITPVMGLPLPFLSYGGTSLIINMMMAGLLLNAHRNHRINRAM